MRVIGENWQKMRMSMDERMYFIVIMKKKKDEWLMGTWGTMGSEKLGTVWTQPSNPPVSLA